MILSNYLSSLLVGNSIIRPHIHLWGTTRRKALGNNIQVNLWMMDLHSRQSCPGTTYHFPIDKLQDSRSIIELLEQFCDAIWTGIQRIETVMKIIQAVTASHQKFSTIINAVLEKSDYRSFIGVVPEIAIIR